MIAAVAGAYRRFALLAILIVLAAGVTSWYLLHWHWLALAFGTVVTGQLFFNDLAYDRPYAVPRRVRVVWVWLRTNHGFFTYPLVAAGAVVLWHRMGWAWLAYASVFAGAAAALEVAAVVVARRTVPLRGPRSCTRALLTALVAVWLDVSLLALTMGQWVFMPSPGEIVYLRLLVPALMVALVFDVRVVGIYRNFWPRSH